MNPLRVHLSRQPDAAAASLYRSIGRWLEYPDNKAILLVPDQYTVEAEQALFDFFHRDSLLRLQVKSFSSLARDIFEEGQGRKDLLLSGDGQKMVLRLLLEEEGEDWKVFNKEVRGPGFLALLADQIREFKEYGIGPEDLSAMAETMDPDSLSREKLLETARMMASYEGSLAGRLDDEDDRLRKAFCQVRDGKKGRGAFFPRTGFFFEHFHSLSKTEVYALESLLSLGPVDLSMLLDIDLARELLRADDRTPDQALSAGLDRLAPDAGAFALSLRFLGQVKGLARDRGGRVEIIPAEKDPGDPFGYLASSVFSYRTPMVPDGDFPLTLREYRKTESEVDGLVLEIRKLVLDHGARYKDIQVILMDQEEYRGFLREKLEGEDIPFFDDDRRSVHFHPLMKLLEAGLEVVEKGPTVSAYLRLLKSGMLGLSNREIEIYQSYISQRKIMGRTLDREDFFTMDPVFYHALIERGQEEEAARLADHTLVARSVQERIKEALAILRGGEDKAPIRDRAKRVYLFLTQDLIKTSFLAYGKSLEEEGKREALEVHLQLWDQVMDLLNSTVIIGGDREVTASVYLKILEEGLSEMKLGVIPPYQDQVVISSLTRSRVRTRPYVFMLGVNDKNLPQAAPTQGLFTPLEKESFRERGFFLPSMPDFRAEEERLNFYSAIRKVGSHLYVFTAKLNRGNESLRPSYWMQGLARAARKEIDFVADFSLEDALYSRTIRLALLPDALREEASADENGEKKGKKDKAERILSLMDRTPWPRDLGLVGRALHYTNDRPPLREEVRSALFSGDRVISATGLETYAACPYQSFVRSILRIKEPRTLEFDALDLGNLLHDSLSAWSAFLGDHLQELDGLTEEASFNRALEAYRETQVGLLDRIKREDPKNAYLLSLTEKSLMDSHKQVFHQVKGAHLAALRQELSFGPGRAFPGLLIGRTPAGEASLLQGRIDRVDEVLVGEGPDREIFRQVIDYKSGNKPFDLTRLLYGLDLQLALYLKAVTRKARPFGFFYMSLRPEDIIKVGDAKSLDQYVKDKGRNFLGSLRLDGIMVDEDSAFRAMDSRMVEKKTTKQSDIYKLGASQAVLRRKEDGRFEKVEGTGSVQARLFTADQMDRLLDQALDKAGQLDRDRRSGRIDIAPYRTATKQTPCAYCNYRSICKFEPRGQFGCFRTLETVPINEWKGRVE